MDPSAPESTPLPWDTTIGNRFAPYSDINHSATLWIASLLGLIYAFGTLFIRLFIKFKVLGVDDYLIIASSVGQEEVTVENGLIARQVIALGQFITIYESLGDGLGKTEQFVPNVLSVGKVFDTAECYPSRLTEKTSWYSQVESCFWSPSTCRNALASSSSVGCSFATIGLIA